MVGLVSSLKLPWGSSIDHVVVAVVAGGGPGRANRQGRSMRSALACGRYFLRLRDLLKARPVQIAVPDISRVEGSGMLEPAIGTCETP